MKNLADQAKNRRYIDIMGPEMLTPSEIAQNSHRAEVKKHYDGLNDELRTGATHSCYLCEDVQPKCDSCGTEAKGTVPTLRRRGWAFDVDGNDFCDQCNPYNELKQVIAKAEERLADIPMGAAINFDDLIFGKETA